MHSFCATLYNLQRSMGNIHQKWKKDHILHQKRPKIIQRMALASNKEILFNNDNEDPCHCEWFNSI